MKNHMRINGQLLQTNKKWGHLKEKQKTWIMETARQEYDCFVRERIYEVIEARGIWIPYGEVKRVLDARIAHWNRQTGAAAVSDESEIPSPPTLENQT